LNQFKFQDNSLIATTDDSGLICVFGQDKLLKKSLKGFHEESVATLSFSRDSKVMLTGCTIGNIRIFLCADFDGEINLKLFNKINYKSYFTADDVEPVLLIDNAHDMGVLSADFSKVIRFDRKSIILLKSVSDK
jgi:WD40 repeat protein